MAHGAGISKTNVEAYTQLYRIPLENMWSGIEDCEARHQIRINVNLINRKATTKRNPRLVNGKDYRGIDPEIILRLKIILGAFILG